MKGTVIRSTGSWFTVKTENGVIHECRIKGKFRIQGIKSTNPVAVGDYVGVELIDSDGMITELFDRKNYIIRKSTNLSKQTHIIAANVDQAAIIVSVANPKTPLGFIDRFLATAEAYSIPCLVIFNKTDLCTSKKDLEELSYHHAIYTSLGYNCIQTSATKNIGLDELKKKLKDKITLISGQSGVGKSSLINAIEPTLDLKTATVSGANEKGRHTSTFAEMFDFSFGGSIIDTPGIRSFGVVDFDKYQLPHYFREFFEIGKNCKFSDCLHINEPGCAVKKALENGEIAESRYTSYWNLYIDEDLETDYK